MDRYNKFLVSLGSFLTSLMCALVSTPLLVMPPVLQAEESIKNIRYSLQGEKTLAASQYFPSTVELPDIKIVENSGRYQIKVVANIGVPAQYVRHVLTDYSHIYRLNPSIIESELLKQDVGGSATVRTKVIGCVAYYCEELDRVETVRVLSSGDLHAEIIPELSDFKSGHTRWQIKTVAEHCEVTYFSDVEPDIILPPIVGKYLLKKSIREEMQISFANLEKISTILAEREWQDDYRPVHTETAFNTPCINRTDDSFGTAY